MDRPLADRAGAAGRNAPADALKAFAIIGVLFIHASAAGFYKPDSFSDASLLPSLDWTVCLVLSTLSRASVPIFLMCTGVLMLNPERNISLKRLWTHNIPRLLCALLVWAFLYQVRAMAVKGALTAGWLYQAVRAVVLFYHEGYLYYLHIALLIYALLPALRAITAHTDRRTLQYLLSIWVAVGLVYPTWKGEWPLNLLKGVPAQYGLNLAYSSIGYTLLGWYLSRYAKTPWKWAAAGTVGYLSIFLTVLTESMEKRRLIATAFEGTFPGVALAAAGVCGWTFAWLRSRSVPRWVTGLSRASFCVYLSHMMFLNWFRDAGLSALSGPCILSVPVTVAAVLACSLALYLVLRRVPVAGRLLT